MQLMYAVLQLPLPTALANSIKQVRLTAKNTVFTTKSSPANGSFNIWGKEAILREG